LGDYNLAYREFCRVFEMAGSPSAGGIGRRAAFGIKMCLRKLDATAATAAPAASGSGTKAVAKTSAETAATQSAPKRARDIDAMITQELLKAYAKG
jgi:hypothetical protein